jgi:hypothetical protein
MPTRRLMVVPTVLVKVEYHGQVWYETRPAGGSAVKERGPYDLSPQLLERADHSRA